MKSYRTLVPAVNEESRTTVELLLTHCFPESSVASLLSRMPSLRLPPSRLPPGTILCAILLAWLTTACFHFPGRSAKAKPATATANRTAASGTAQPPPGMTTGPAHETAGATKSGRPLPGHRIGTIRTVGTGGRFVLVEIFAADNTTAIRDGQELSCVHPETAGPARPAAIVRISAEHRPPFVVADVINGEPHIGDEIYFIQGGNTLPPPAPTPPVTSFLVPTTLFPATAPSPTPHATP